MNYLVTGSAGFIGFHTSLELLRQGHSVIGVDNLNDYYDVNLKKDRIKFLNQNNKKKFTFYKIDLSNKLKTQLIFKKNKIDKVIHLAAQAGVRYSILKPEMYLKNNIIVFFNILENCRNYKIKHLLFASTSSVYGLQTKNPFKVEDACNHPIQFYAATKKSNEMMAHSYSHLYNIPMTGLRFFTVYGPWGRPDMALNIFTKKILKGQKINVFNYGNHVRDFTYVDNIVENIISLSKKNPKKNKDFNSKNPKNHLSSAPFRILNIGNTKPEKLMDFVKEIEINLRKKAKINFMKLQKGDIEKTV
ncbi:NAD-dependent epimerase/dehydratase family protein, partial [Candidatus Pelagibacter ubique]|nr:NAD-dependent epimerase/dehydratase family protein [Candidatus Pelagibacter ubique]